MRLHMQSIKFIQNKFYIQVKTIKHFNWHTEMHDRSRLLLHYAYKKDACPWLFCYFYLRFYLSELIVYGTNSNPMHTIALSNNGRGDNLKEEKLLLACDHCSSPLVNDSSNHYYYFESDGISSTLKL